MRRQLPPRTLDEVIAAWPAYRQTILSTMDNCALATRFALEAIDTTNAAQARGIIFHRYAAEYLRTLQRTGEVQMPTEEAMQILVEVCRQRDVPDEEVVIVPARERRLLRIAALRLAAIPLDMKRLISVEQKLETTLEYDHPELGQVKRTIGGTPDALLADPPNGAVVLDWKTAPSAPAEGAQPYWTGDHLHVSYGGYFQQRFYALLVLDNYPSADRATLREFYVLPGEARNAEVPREALEHIRVELAGIVEMLDRAMMGGSKSKVWRPSPGHHCGYCPRPASCPVLPEERVAEGAITSDAQAARVAAQVAVASEFRDAALPSMKAYHDATGRPIPVKDAKGRREWRWGTDSAGKRRFKQHTPIPREKRDDQIDGAFGEVQTTRTRNRAEPIT